MIFQTYSEMYLRIRIEICVTVHDISWPATYLSLRLSHLLLIITYHLS